MYFKQFYDEGLAQASYLIGCQAMGVAIVVDARRDIEPYLVEAERQGLRITAVTETHIHADYLSGSRELAHATSATLYLSDEGGPDWLYGFAHHGLRDGGEIRLGNIALRAVHTPGHTPEHLSFLVTDGATASEPGFLLSGDFVFVGDVGRPDLLDEAAGFENTRFQGAKDMFTSLQEKFLTLPDYVQVWPAHGAGSACGKALGAVASSTVGYERRFAWWAKFLEGENRDDFTRELLAGQPDAPSYFARMKRENKLGPALLGERAALTALDAEGLQAAVRSGRLIVDARSREDFDAGAVNGSISVPFGKSFSTWAGWLLDPESDPRDLVLIAAGRAQAEQLRDELARVGVDRVTAYATSLSGSGLVARAQVSPADLPAPEKAFLLDVRTKNEYLSGHLPGATQLHAGRLSRFLHTLPRDRQIVVYCQGGSRSGAAASFLRSRGFENLIDLQGGYDAWIAAPRERVQA